MNSNQRVKNIRRRRLLQGIGWFSGSLLLSKGCASPGANGTADLAQAPSSSSQTPSSPVTGSSNVCVLYPEQTEGPYYIDLDRVRQDITEGKDGIPLKLLLNITDAEGCTPISGAAMDIWHCDAAGNYAGYSAAATSTPDGGYGEAATPSQRPADGNGSGQPGRLPAGDPPPGRNAGGHRAPTSNDTFLRGTQITDVNGQVEFDTIYPGWYRGRTTHIHLKVHLDANTVLTSQMYFPEEITRAVYAQTPYNDRPDRDTTNAQDFILKGNETVVLNLTETGNGYTGRLTIGVAR